jgi:DNA-binding LytR/AlgR family response regulator
MTDTGHILPCAVDAPVNILVCDDNEREINELAALLHRLGYKPNLFKSAHAALNYIKTGGLACLCFLDIVMPEMNGIELARRLRAHCFTGPVVFLSASRDYGPEAFAVKAFHYLIKPPTLESVGDVLAQIKTSQENADTAGIRVQSKGGTRFIPFRSIVYAEIIDHTVHIRLTDGSTAEVRVSLAEIAPRLLCDKRFLQCNRSYIINQNSVSNIKGNEITMQTGAKIPISRGYSGVKDTIAKWMIGV